MCGMCSPWVRRTDPWTSRLWHKTLFLAPDYCGIPRVVLLRISTITRLHHLAAHTPILFQHIAQRWHIENFIFLQREFNLQQWNYNYLLIEFHFVVLNRTLCI